MKFCDLTGKENLTGINFCEPPKNLRNRNFLPTKLSILEIMLIMTVAAKNLWKTTNDEPPNISNKSKDTIFEVQRISFIIAERGVQGLQITP